MDSTLLTTSTRADTPNQSDADDHDRERRRVRGLWRDARQREIAKEDTMRRIDRTSSERAADELYVHPPGFGQKRYTKKEVMQRGGKEVWRQSSSMKNYSCVAFLAGEEKASWGLVFLLIVVVPVPDRA